MSLSIDLSDDLSNGNLKVLDDLTSSVKQIQDDVLKEILTLNADTEYLHRFLHGSSDKDLFTTNVPVVTYEDLKPYIDRLANGEPSDILSALPICGFFLSSGTSGAKQQILPQNDKYLENMRFVYDLRSLIISKHFEGVEQGKGMLFLFTRQDSTTSSSCLPATTVTTSFFKSKYFRDRPSYWYNSYTSPDEVIWCPDNKHSLYCHFLCGLVQRDDVVRLGAIFASVMIRAITFLETFWKELCSNIRSGQLSEWITDLSCRASVSIILGGPNPELADFIEHKCSQKSWEGILRQLWPNAKFIEGVFTGQMAQYIPTLDFYSNKLPLVTTSYGSSETFFGTSLNPLSKPQDVAYTFIPNIAYFEFSPVDKDNNNELVQLADEKLGYYYSPVVTTYSGLYRYKVDDILEVTGFHNNAPQFKFAQRKNVVLSIQTEATTEVNLLKAVTNAKLILESSDFMLLEIRVVQKGTYDALMDFFVSRGGSVTQYKTPLCIKSTEALGVLKHIADRW